MIRRAVCVFIVLFLLPAGIAAAGKNTVEIDHIEALDEMFSGPYLAWDTIPEEERNETFYIEWSQFLSMYGNGSFPYATSLKLTFTEGDKQLLKALSFSSKQLHLDYKKLKEPGEVSFHIHAEANGRDGERCVHDGDYTLKVIAWEGPVMSFRDDVTEISKGLEQIPYPEFFSQIATYADYAQGMPIQSIWFDRGSSGRTFVGPWEAGDHPGREVVVDFGTVMYAKKLDFHINPFKITGNEKLYRGMTAGYTVTKYDVFNMPNVPEESFTFTAEGDGVTMEDNGVVAVAEDAPAGEKVKLTAVCDSNGLTVEREVTVCEVPWIDMDYGTVPMGGFGVPVPNDGSFKVRFETDRQGQDQVVASVKRGPKYTYTLLYSEPDDPSRQGIREELRRIADGQGLPVQHEFFFNDFPGMVLQNEVTYQDGQEDGAQGSAGTGDLETWTASVYIQGPETGLEISILWRSADGDVVPEATTGQIMEIVRRITWQGEAAVISDGEPEADTP